MEQYQRLVAELFPEALDHQREGERGRALERPEVVAEVDARGVARLDRLVDAATTFGPTTLRVQLTPKNGRWVLVGDAWFFKEGDGERGQVARYGEFRVMPDGRALLVGMADANLKPIR